MMWGNRNKTELIAEAAALQRENEIQAQRIEELKGQIERLDGQVAALQRALVAKEAPAAFADMVEDEDENPPPWVEQRLRETKILQEISRVEEDPLFRDPEEMISALTMARGVPSPGAAHDNEES